MPSLIYAPVSILKLLLAISKLANKVDCVGIRAPRHGDEHLHAAHRPSSLHMEA